MKVSSPQIAAFTHAARERSFSKAAKVLGITQSAVTQHVARLEREMGTQLFLRTRGGLELTKPALELFALSDRMRTAEQLIAEKIAAYGTLSAGHLDVVANAPRPALPLIRSYCRRFPDVKLTFTLASWTLAMDKLRRREIDIAVITEPDLTDDLVAVELARVRYMAYMRADHPLAGRPEISLRELETEPLVLPEAGSLTRRIVGECLAAHGLQLRRMIEMTTFPVVKEAILHGIGVGILLEESFYPSGQLVMRPIRELSESYRTCLVAAADRSELRTVREFIDLAEEAPSAE